MTTDGRRPAWDRFWGKVDCAFECGRCWIWVGSRTTGGYGHFKYNKKDLQAHRVAYEWLRSPIPVGLQLDHLCRVRACVNPEHLEPVTQAENHRRGYGPQVLNARKTECIHGHPLFGDNLHVHKDGRRECKTCGRRSSRDWTQRRREAAQREAAKNE
jgi:hypothetical protein